MDRPRLVLRPAPDTVDTSARMEAAEFDDLPSIAESDDPTDWPARRAHLLGLFEDHVYGRVPDFDHDLVVDEIERGVTLGGRGQRRQIRIGFGPATDVEIDVLIHTPSGAAPVPGFLIPNFEGNHTTSPETEILESAAARRDRGDDIAARGSKSHRFPIEAILDRGYGLVTFYAADVDADADDGFAFGIQRAAYRGNRPEPLPDEWGTIGAWAWACSRVLDALADETEEIDAARMIVGGHSRLGKTALWAAAQDERFAGAISNNSGCTGAALSRRRFGENVAVINALFPHWFCRNYRFYGDNEDALPIDQHQLLALIAPRPLHVASATEDLWADPVGEFLATKAAGEAWERLGSTGLALDEFPTAGSVSIGPVSYHLRDGAHDLLAFDWTQFLDFADANLSP